MATAKYMSTADPNVYQYHFGDWITGNLSAGHMANKENAFNQIEAATARQFAAEEAQKNRDWQEYMSNTAYQRKMSDLKAAGLNPILAAGGQPASTPAGSAAAPTSASAVGRSNGGLSSLIGSVVSSAVKLAGAFIAAGA